MLLKEILHNIVNLRQQITNEIFDDYEINEIKDSSEEIKAGDLFVAVKGLKVDASKFIPNAIKAGSKVILCEDTCQFIPRGVPSDILILKSSEIKEDLGKILSNFYPNKPEHIIGVTGTNGKTTVAELTRQCLHQLGCKAASIGSLGVIYNLNGKEERFQYKHSLTNPALIEFHKYLSELKSKGIEYIVTEATSQGMRNGRINGIQLDTGSFTNITHDHIGNDASLHKDFEDYFRCKMMLYTKYTKKGGYAVFNANIPQYNDIRNIALENELQIVDYGHNADFIQIKDIKATDYGQDIFLKLSKEEIKIELGIIGKFQVHNICCVIGNLISLGFEDRIKELDFRKIHSATGRGDFIAELKNGAKIFIDYPTTEDALKNTIDTFREYQNDRGSDGRVIILFGAGGDRDPNKRPKMGKIATDLADLAIVTEDSPRTEAPSQIRNDIMKGCDPKKAISIGNDAPKETVEGRIRALRYAISILEKDDILITNKGHETYIEINGINESYPEKELIQKFVIEHNKDL